MATPLDRTGKLIVDNVRDLTLDKVDDILAGKLNSKQGKAAYKKLAHLKKEELEAIKELAIITVDSTLHSLLFLMEESVDIDLCHFSPHGCCNQVKRKKVMAYLVSCLQRMVG